MDIIERLNQNITWLARDGFETSAKNLTVAKAEIESLRQQLTAALAACAAKDAAIDAHLNPCGCFNGCSFCDGKVTLQEAIAIKPDTSILKAHDEALIEKIAQRMADSGIGGKYIAEAIRELKGKL